MRVLVLVDDLDDLAYENHPELIPPLAEPSVHRDLALVLPGLDPDRVQITTLAVTGSGERSLNAKTFFDLRAVRPLCNLIREQEIELIHALSARSALIGGIAGRITERPTLASIYQVADVPVYNAFQRGWRRIRQLILRWGIDRIVVPTNLVRQNLWRIHYPEQRIDVVYPGIPLVHIDPPDRVALGLPNGPLIAMIAPLTADQGFTTLLEAMPRLLQRVPSAHVVVVGTGPLARELHAKTRMEPIRWLGDKVDARQIIEDSDVVILHPQRGGLPLAILEAGSCGKVVVSSRVGGVTEVIEHGVNGLLVTYADAADFAVQISRVLLQANFARAMGISAEKKVNEHFSLDVQRENMTTLYESTIYSSR